MSFDAVVIGGGINGLVAATVLARKGQKLCLLERSGALGGMAAGNGRMAHLLWNLSPLVRREVGMKADRWPFGLTSIPSVALSPDGSHVILRGVSASFADGTPHPQADIYRQLHRQLVDYGDLLRSLAEGGPPGIDGPWTSRAALKEIWRLGRFGLRLKRMDKPQMRRFLQVLLSNAYDLILDDLKDGPLAGLLAADAVRGAAAGPRSPGTVFSLIYRLGHGGDLSLPTDGMGAVIDAFETAARSAGVEIRMDTGVSRVIVEGDQVIGVETSTGDVLNASRVLSSTGALRTAQMAGFASFDIEATRRLRNLRAKGTTAKINLTLDKPLEVNGISSDLGAARYVLAPSADYVEQAFNPSKYRQMSKAPVVEAVMPDPQSLSIITQYAPVDLDGGWNDAAKAQLLDITTRALSPYMPDLTSSIAASEVITPDQIEAETGAPGGHWHHAEMALDQLLTIRPVNGMGRYAMGPKGLYLCGASAHPGGDLMGLSGRNAAHAALEAGS